MKRFLIALLAVCCLCVFAGPTFADTTDVSLEKRLTAMNFQTVSDTQLSKVRGEGLWSYLAKKALVKIFGPKAWIDRYLKALNPLGDPNCEVPLLPWFLQPKCALSY